ncbi:MAG: Na(+)/H(+) antiporter subunit D [Candidatus Puniceispirillales bacterium]
MINSFPPGLVMFLGAFLVPFFPHIYRQFYMLFLVFLSASALFSAEGSHLIIQLQDIEFILHHSDNLSFPFAIVFHIAAFLVIIYGSHIKDWKEQLAILSYSGAAIAALHAGDLFTLFLWWEATAFTSVILIFCGKTYRAYKSAIRYIVIQVGSGILLLSGAILLFQNSNEAIFQELDINSTAGLLVFIAFGIKAAFPFFNGWLQDSYPEASEVGTVALSAFTTKLAIYALARSFAGVEILIYIGALMTFFPIFFAVIENDLRRVLAFSLNNQLGFMVVAIGIGTELAINGAVAHAFAHIIYKGLLFMSMGAVLYRVGTCKASELGGLFKYMPITAICSIVGAVSISAFPLFSGFVAKSLIMSSLGYEGLTFIYFMLLFASAGVLHHSGIKIPFFAFFAHDSGLKPKEAPMNMIVAMLLSSLLCILIGIFPSQFYQILPYNTYYQPYDFSHVLSQLQLLMFAVFAFICLWHFKIYPPELNSTVLNSDWFYRVLFYKIINIFINRVFRIWDIFSKNIISLITFLYQVIQRSSVQSGNSAVKVGRSTVLILFSLGFVLLCNYLLF